MTDKSFSCVLDPDLQVTLKVYLFKNVKNVDVIRNNVLSDSWRCSVVKPALVLHPLQLAAAANRAALHHRAGTASTRTLYAELLYNLSLTKNISQSLKKFGIEDEQDMLICFVESPDEQSSSEIIQQVEGEQCTMNELRAFTDLQQIKTAYKLKDITSDDKLLDAIISKMVTKNIISY